VARAQDCGRGRQGRAWTGLDGNFFGSTLVLVGRGDPAATTLSLAAGLALLDALQLAAPQRHFVLKWPNDVLLDGGKLAGILLERSGERLIAGFGVNLRSAPALPDRRTADLGGCIDPGAFAPLLAASFGRQLRRWREGTNDALLAAWLERAHPVGTPLSVHDGSGRKLRGTFDGLGPDGALLLRLGSGAVERVRSGDTEL
jgi:BirA family transcriptional regulator, biotin operon repressor / biotin---[acetyl-CoA-carboxylase] ligase